ncbi:MAG: lipoate--protein ligase family protein [Candidatus Methanofastidiosa archaeon]|nr:lipoate--protein ligase family protein [Candidatus Methanofastidiosa archaeon]
MERWRVIGPEGHDIYEALALEEVSMESVLAGGDPIIRFWYWKGDSASVGRFQCIGDEIDIGYASARGISLARRPSGGGAVYNGEGEEILYSVVARTDMGSPSIEASFRGVCSCIQHGLGMMGIEAEFEGPANIMVDGQKISGNSKWIRKRASLQHGTILYRPDRRAMNMVLKLNEASSCHGTPSKPREVTGIKEHSEVGFFEALRLLMDAFSAGKRHYPGTWTTDEANRAKELEDKKYRRMEWVFSR